MTEQPEPEQPSEPSAQPQPEPEPAPEPADTGHEEELERLTQPEDNEAG